MEMQEKVHGYEDQCVITVGEWTQSPWESDDHAYYQFFNDLDMVCFYIPEDDYETCYAYFRGYDAEKDNAYWEFSEGNAWLWTECGELKQETEEQLWNCYGGEWSVGPDDFSYSEMSGWEDMDYYSWGSDYYWGEYYSWGYYYWDDMYYYDGRRDDRRGMGALKTAFSSLSLAAIAYISM